MDIDRSKPVLVTGASGYIASWLVKYLLDDGIDVHGTVRDKSDDTKVGHLKRIAESSPGRLTLFEADLLDDGAFDVAMGGCELVFHTASPFVFSGIKDPQKELVDPAVAGTRSVLESANRTFTVDRVVLTSSVVSIYGDAADLKHAKDDVFTEDDWNTTSSLTHQPYSYSKVAAEKAAWEIADAQDRWDLVVINPGFVLGPSLITNSDSYSLKMIQQYVDGSLRTGAPALELGIVDVRDVAMAHIKAGYSPDASGRHICVSRSMSMLEVGHVLTEHFGKRSTFPRRTLPKAVVWLVAPAVGLTHRYVSANVGHPLRFDNTRARKELGAEFRPPEETLVEHFQQMIDDGIARDKRT
jgi:nucleoside-diphosphate-sugar epimerase